MTQPNPLRLLFTELRRRRVHTVAAVYAGAAFVVLQAAELAVEPLRLPEWTMALLFVVAAVGLGLTLVLAWMFQLGPDGVTRSPSVLSTSGRSSRNAAYTGLGILIGLIAVGAYGVVGRTAPPDRRDTGEPIGSIAVLPFVNVGGDPGEEYFADGLAEELLDALANVENLRVPARTSSFAFKGQQLDVREIGRRLRVEVVLEGSVRRAGDRLRVTAQLVDVGSGYTMFSETYDRRADDVFALQEELSRSILAAIHLEPDNAGDAVVRRATADAGAHDHYLAGLYHFHRRGASVDSAIAQFRTAVALDSSYADAWGGLASAYSVAPYFLRMDPDSARAAGQRAAQHALDLDPDQALAHAALGQIAANFDWDFASAVAHYERALAVSPSNANTRQWLAESLHRMGRLDEALAQLDQARTLDPFSVILAQMSGIVLAAAGRMEDALAELERGRRLDTERFTGVRVIEAVLLVRLGRCEEAVRVVTEGLPDDDERRAQSVFYAAPCDPSLLPQARALADIAASEVEAADPGAPPAINIALMYDLIGETAQAESWLLRAYVKRDPSLPDLMSYATSDELRRRPAVQAALREMGMDWLLAPR